MKHEAKLSIGSKLVRGMFICAITLFGTTACDANVQTALVSGLSQASTTAATALISAAFLSITPDEEDAAQ